MENHFPIVEQSYHLPPESAGRVRSGEEMLIIRVCLLRDIRGRGLPGGYFVNEMGQELLAACRWAERNVILLITGYLASVKPVQSAFRPLAPVLQAVWRSGSVAFLRAGRAVRKANRVLDS